MKKSLLSGCIIICLPVFIWAQQAPVQWEVTAQKNGHDGYTLQIKGSVMKGWHVYAAADTALGLEPVTINWNNESILKDESSIVLDRGGKVNLDFQDPVFENKMVKVHGSEIYLEQDIKVNGIVPASFELIIKGFASNNKEFLSLEESKKVNLEGGVDINQDQILKLSSIDLEKPAVHCGDAILKNASLFTIFLKGFAGGLIALLLPCLFPMIPVTVSFFTNRADSRRKAINNSVLYGLSIVGIYLLASLPFHLLSNVDSRVFNAIATNAWINFLFFLVFILFSLSLFGVFELTLPSSFANKAGAKSGIFFMALTLVIVSFSCTGPILGTLLVGSLSADGNPWELTAGMGAFGLALALPFAMFAMFPQLLQSLPKSGSWLEVIKKSLAFAELALAIKFLSNADLVEHWGILKREVFIGLWILIALGLALYLFGAFDKKKKITTLHVINVTQPKRSYGRFALGTLTLIFLIYLVPGITQSKHANVRLLSGFAPPLSYSIYGTDNVKGKGVEPDAINDYAKALALSKQTGKPLLIDFTGWACVNCRKMEEQVWTKKEIESLIKEKFILVSLYVDDRQKLPPEKQFNFAGKEIKTVGDKWAAFQEINFRGVSQPMYAVLSPDEKLMNLPVGYSGVNEYKQWLECGLGAWQQVQSSSALKLFKQ